MTKRVEERDPRSTGMDRRAFLGASAVGVLEAGRQNRPESIVRCRPPDFPPEIPLRRQRYRNWSLSLEVSDVWWSMPRGPEDVATLANWARDHGYTLRPVGHSHNWSPIVVTQETSPCNVLLVDTKGLKGEPTFHPGPFPAATFGIGTTVEEATRFLETLDNQGTGAAPGFTLQNMTAPGKLTLGGALAIGAHGTGGKWKVAEPDLNGCLSNLVLWFEAVVTDPYGSEPGDYVIQRFERDHPDASAFLVHLGRAFLTRVCLRVVPNFYLQVDNRYPRAQVLFKAPASAPSNESLSALLHDFGRVEVTWFPFTDRPWVKTWLLRRERIDPQVPGPYNYPWQNVGLVVNNLFKMMLFAVPSLTPWFERLVLSITERNAPAGVVLNGKSMDLLLYVEKDTLRFDEFSWALQIRRDQVQEIAHALSVRFTKMLERYRLRGAYPVNGPLEIRFSTMDRQAELGVHGAGPPALSPCRSVRPEDPELDTVLWFSLLTMPGTPHANEFFREFEIWMLRRWGQTDDNVIRPEWSKNWAYGKRGAWTNRRILRKTIPGQFNQPKGEPHFDSTRRTLQAYDKHHLFTNRFLDVLLPG